jgi:hypothetical protein
MTEVVRFNGIGLADGYSLSAGDAGTGDTPIDGRYGNAQGALFHEIVTDDPDMDVCWEMASVGGETSYLQWLFSAPITEGGVRVYLKKLSEVASANQQWGAVYSSTSSQYSTKQSNSGSVTPGQIRTYEDGTSTWNGTPSDSIDGDVWYRVEVYWRCATDQYRQIVYVGDSTSALHDTDWVTAGAGRIQSQVDQYRLGSVINTPPTCDTLRFAHLLVTDDSDTLIGPYVAATSATYVKTSTGLKPGTMYVKTAGGLISATDVVMK